MADLVSQFARRSNRSLKEEAVRWALFTCALVSVATTAGIIYTLASEGIAFFKTVSLFEFLTGTTWAPLFDPPRFGVLPLLAGTMLVTVIAAVIAVPVGLLAAIYLNGFASQKARARLKPLMEILAGIPTVVYGYLALQTITPAIQQVFPQTQVFNALSGAIAVAVMILPTIASLCDDALRAVPSSLRHAAFAMGATRMEVSMQVMLPAALSGVIAAVILAVSRAVGETMIVVIACGGQPALTLNPLEPVQTMTAYIVAISLGDTPRGTTGYYTIFAVGGLLFLITLGMNVIAHKVLRRFREVYD